MATDVYRGAAGNRTPPQGKKEDRYTLPSTSDFTFIANPESYDVYVTSRGAEVLPILSKHLHQVGLHGNDPRTGDPSGALGIRGAKGLMIVPKSMKVTAFGDADQGYTQWFPTSTGATHFCHVWKRPYKVGESTYWNRDRDGYHAFLRAVKNDVMPPIDPNVLRALKSGLERMLTIEIKRGRESQVAKLRAKLEAFAPKPKPKPKPKRRAPKPSPDLEVVPDAGE